MSHMYWVISDEYVMMSQYCDAWSWEGGSVGGEGVDDLPFGGVE